MNQQIPEKCDVLVIGGGPAGAMAAALLAKKGVEVIVLEKEQFPREIVGESLIPHFWRYLDLIDVSDRIMDAGFVAKCGGATFWNGKFKKMSFADFGYKRPGMHVERAEFDDILLKRAEELGASVFFNTKVTKIIHNEDWSEAIYKTKASDQPQIIKAKYIVDASGQNALLGRQEKIRVYDEGFRFHAFWGYFKGGNYLDKNATIRPFGEHFTNRPLTVVSTIGDWGWVWQILLREKTSIGVILPKTQMAEFKKRGSTMDERFQSLVRETPLTGELMKNAQPISGTTGSIKDYAYKPDRLTVGNSFLIGDALAFVDPINSAGIVMALYGGFLAAWSIKRILDKPENKKQIQEMFSSQLKLRLDLFRLIAYPSDMISKDMIEEGRKILSQLNDREKYLALTQITLTNRADNLPELLGLPIKNFCHEVPLSNILASANSDYRN